MKIVDGETPAANPMTLLEELDVRQEEVLAQLDDLNAKIERLLLECSSTRGQDAEAAPAAPLPQKRAA